MFSMSYFKYLVSSKKYLLILILMITLLNTIGNSIKGLDLIFQGVLAIGLSFALPAIVFYHVHDKKAVDTYFSLPVSRKKLLWTGILFCSAIVFMVIVAGIVAFRIKCEESFNMFAAILEMLLASLSLVIFNTGLYLIGNDVVDGFVMMGAYTVLPLMIYAVISGFYFNYVAGGMTPDLEVIRLFSPLYMSAEMLVEVIDTNRISFGSVIGLSVLLVLFVCLLHRWYVERPVERAGSRSDAFYSYPLIINLYLVICLFLISTMFGVKNKSILTFVGDSILLYILLFAVFVAAYFVYRRKMYFNYRLPAFYIAVMVVSLLFALLCRNSKGFGLADRYERASGKDFCMINGWYDEKDRQLEDYLFEQTGERPEYYNIYIEIGNKEADKFPQMSQTTSEILEKYREKAIEDFYEGEYGDKRGASLTFVTKDGLDYYHYTLNGAVSFEDIMALAQDEAVNARIDTFEQSYRIYPDGTLHEASDQMK